MLALEPSPDALSLRRCSAVSTRRAAPRCDSLRRVVVPINVSNPPTITSPDLLFFTCRSYQVMEPPPTKRLPNNRDTAAAARLDIEERMSLNPGAFTHYYVLTDYAGHRRSPLTARRSPLTAHRSPLTPSPLTAITALTAHPLTAHRSPLTAHPLTAHRSPLTAHRSPLAARRPLSPSPVPRPMLAVACARPGSLDQPCTAASTVTSDATSDATRLYNALKFYRPLSGRSGF
jgi:hypothetical protein